MEPIALPGSLSSGRILVATAEAATAALLESTLLAAGCEAVWCTLDALEVLPLLERVRPDLLLLDLQVPRGSGLDVLEQVQAAVPPGEYFPVLALTGDLSREARSRALLLGARDFLNQPLDPTELVPRVSNLLETRRLHQQLATQSATLEARVRERTMDLEAAQFEILDRLALAGDLRDDATGAHAKRVGQLSSRLATQLGLPAAEVELIRLAAPLHDVGKIAVSDAVLRKPAALTAEEILEVRGHAHLGGLILSGSAAPILQLAEDIARHHHERWDGSGYFGHSGQAISVASRLVAVCDVFDALTSVRPYKATWPFEEALDEIRRLSGVHFDPEIVRAFSRLESFDVLVPATSLWPRIEPSAG